MTDKNTELELGDLVYMKKFGLLTVTHNSHEIFGFTQICSDIRKKNQKDAMKITISEQQSYFIKTFCFSSQGLAIYKATNLSKITKPVIIPPYKTDNNGLVVINPYGINASFHVVQSKDELPTPEGFLKNSVEFQNLKLFTFVKAMAETE